LNIENLYTMSENKQLKLIKKHKAELKRLQNKIRLNEAATNGKLGRRRNNNAKKRAEIKRQKNPALNIVGPKADEEFKNLTRVTNEILGRSGNVVNSAQMLPQVNIVDIPVLLSIDALTKLAYVWSLYAISMDVLPGEKIEVNSQIIGMHYLMAVTIAYDLWNATKDNITIFSAAPLAYWELRQALAPKISRFRRLAYSYNFESPAKFFGADGMYPTGFPLTIDNISLSWPSNTSGALYAMNTVVPNLTVENLYDSGPQVCQKIWGGLKKNRDGYTMIEQPELTAFSQSTAAYCAAYDYSTEENQGWTLFSHELKLTGWEVWLSYLGLALVPLETTSKRRGPCTFTEYRGPGSYSHRVIIGHTGKQKKQVIRYKTVYLESFFSGVTGAVLVADTLLTQVNGGDAIVQSIKSRLLEISANQYTMGLTQGILKSFSATSWVGCFNSVCDACIELAAGTTLVPSQECLTMAIPNFYNEMRASLVPKVNERQGWAYVTYPILVCAGKTTANVYENSAMGDAQDLVSLLAAIYPGLNSGGSTYTFKADVSGLPAYFDPVDVTQSWVEGNALNDAVVSVSSIHNQIQGNLMMSTPMANYHTEHTLAYYTAIMVEEPPIQGYSQFHRSIITNISNRVPFSANDVSHDLMNILPSTFMSSETYQSIYSECSSLDYSSAQTQVHNILMTVTGYAHEIAGEGTETQVAHLSFIGQHEGGGFVNFMKKIGQSLLPIATNVVSSLIGGDSDGDTEPQGEESVKEELSSSLKKVKEAQLTKP
jgi:hypothetical protein